MPAKARWSPASAGSRTRRRARRAVQAAEHGAEQRRSRRWRRDRPRPGAAGAGGGHRCARSTSIRCCSNLQPIAARRSSSTATRSRTRCARVSRLQADRARRRAGLLRAAARDYDAIIVEGAGSPAEINLRDRRHRQHGLRGARRLSGDSHCRYRSRRRVRASRRHARVLVGQRAGAHSRLRDQPVSRRYRLAAAGPRWLEAQTGKPVFGVLPYLLGLTSTPRTCCRASRRARRCATR